MAVERAISVSEKATLPFSPEPPQQNIEKIVHDLFPQALEALDPYVSSWAGPEWRIKGLPNNGLLNNKLPEGMHISYFGTIPQGGPALFLVIRMRSGEGLLLQEANPEARSVTGKRFNYIYWDGKESSRDPELGKKFIEGLRKKD